MPSEEDVHRVLQQVAHRPEKWDANVPFVLCMDCVMEPAALEVIGIAGTRSKQVYLTNGLASVIDYELIEFPTLSNMTIRGQPHVALPESYILAWKICTFRFENAFRDCEHNHVYDVIKWFSLFQLFCLFERSPTNLNMFPRLPIAQIYLPVAKCRFCTRGELEDTPFGLCPDCQGTGHIRWHSVLWASRICEEFFKEQQVFINSLFCPYPKKAPRSGHGNANKR